MKVSELVKPKQIPKTKWWSGCCGQTVVYNADLSVDELVFSCPECGYNVPARDLPRRRRHEVEMSVNDNPRLIPYILRPSDQ